MLPLFSWNRRSVERRNLLAVTAIFFAFTTLSGMEVTGFSEARHSRFGSGYDSNPVVAPTPNGSIEFLGSLYNLGGIPWNAGNRQQSYVFLSRKHFLATQHLGAGANLQFFSHVTGLGNAAMSGLTSIPESDLAIGRLTRLLPSAAAIPTYPILDLPREEDFVGRELLMYGWWARVGKSKISTVLPDGRVIDGQQKKYLFEHEPPNDRQDFITLQGMDSGSPSFLPFRGELTLAGNHHYVFNDPGEGQYLGGGDNFLGLPEVIRQVNAILSDDGFALAFLTQPAKTWNSTTGNWGNRNNWFPTTLPGATESLGFDNAGTLHTITLSANRTAKGLLFSGSSGGAGHVFAAGSTLSLGHVGIRNDASTAQTFRCNLTLTAPQHWTAGPGEILVEGDVNLGEFYLNTSGAIRLSGGLEGAGGLTIHQGTTRIAGAVQYTGKTYLYGGVLELEATGGLANSAPMVFGGGAIRLHRSLANASVEILDASRIIFSDEPATLSFVTASWSPGGSIAVEGFRPEDHGIHFGESFHAISPQQRATVSLNGSPAIHRSNGALGMATAYERWALEQFPNDAGNPETRSTLWGPLALPAGDGISNLMKFALGRDATNRSSEPKPGMDAEGHLIIDIARNPEAAGVRWSVEVSPDLGSWSSAPQDIEILTDLPDRLVIRDRTSTLAGQVRFMRVRVALE